MGNIEFPDYITTLLGLAQGAGEANLIARDCNVKGFHFGVGEGVFFVSKYQTNVEDAKSLKYTISGGKFVHMLNCCLAVANQWVKWGFALFFIKLLLSCKKYQK